MPDESAAVRRLDRMYHKDLLVSEGTCECVCVCVCVCETGCV